MSIITAPVQDSAPTAVQMVGDRVGSVGRRFEVDVRGSGTFELTRSLLEWIGEALAASPEVEETILSANLARGTVDMRASVRAGSKSAAHEAAAHALARAMAAIGVQDVQVRRSGWRRSPVATAYAPAAVLSPA